jgi:hypothetical protein
MAFSVQKEMSFELNLIFVPNWAWSIIRTMWTL